MLQINSITESGNRTACENSSLLGGVGGALKMASDVNERMVVMTARTRIFNIGLVQRMPSPISRVKHTESGDNISPTTYLTAYWTKCYDAINARRIFVKITIVLKDERRTWIGDGYDSSRCRPPFEIKP